VGSDLCKRSSLDEYLGYSCDFVGSCLGQLQVDSFPDDVRTFETCFVFVIPWLTAVMNILLAQQLWIPCLAVIENCDGCV